MCKNPSQIFQQKCDTGCKRVGCLIDSECDGSLWGIGRTTQIFIPPLPLGDSYPLAIACDRPGLNLTKYMFCISFVILYLSWWLFSSFLAWQFMMNKLIRKIIYRYDRMVTNWGTNQVTKDAIAFWDNQASYLFDIKAGWVVWHIRGYPFPLDTPIAPRPWIEMYSKSRGSGEGVKHIINIIAPVKGSLILSHLGGAPKNNNGSHPGPHSLLLSQAFIPPQPPTPTSDHKLISGKI